MDAYVEGVRRFGRDAFLIKQIVGHETIEQVPVWRCSRGYTPGTSWKVSVTRP